MGRKSVTRGYGQAMRRHKDLDRAAGDTLIFDLLIFAGTCFCLFLLVEFGERLGLGPVIRELNRFFTMAP